MSGHLISLADFATEFRKAMLDNSRQSLRDKTERFLDAFEWVFEGDWEHTQAALSPETIGHYIEKEGGTFLNPCVDDEGANWFSRAALLYAFRDLKAELARANFVDPQPIDTKKGS
jgi:hypothetical protein